MKATSLNVNDIPCPSCHAQSGELIERISEDSGVFFGKCSRCGAQTLHVSYIGHPSEENAATLRALAVEYWRRGYTV